MDGERLLEFAESLDLVICNSLFKKRKSHLVTYSSGGAQTQTDYILTRLKDCKLLKDVKVVPSEECVSQHRLLICSTVIRFPKKVEKVFTPKVCLWKLKDNEVKQAFEKHVAENAVSLSNSQNVEDIWNILKSKIIKEEYLKAKRHAKSVVYKAKKSAEDERFVDIKQNDKNIFKMAKQIRKDNKDIIGNTCIKDKNDNLCFTNAAKRQAWKDYYQNLLNTEFPWSEDDLPPIDAVLGPPPLITKEETVAAIRSIKNGKAPGPSGIVSGMLKASLETSSEVITSLANAIIREERIPSEWNDSYILSLFKGKGSASALGNYRGLKLTDHVLKVLERTVEKHIREIISVDEMQFGFMPGVGTTDAIFIMSQLQEKYLAKRRNLYLAFVDLEKAFDRVPRKVIWWAMRVAKIPEWMVRVDCEYSNVFSVNVGVHQGSVLSSLLFLIVLEALSREFRTGCPWEFLYADDLAIVAETRDEFKNRHCLWKQKFAEKGLKVNVAKTKVLISGRGMNTIKESGNYPCGVCLKGVGVNSIYCSNCKHWIHKRCSKVSGPIKSNVNFKCQRCQGLAPAIDKGDMLNVVVDNESIEVVGSFCYLGDMITSGGGCSEATVVCCRAAWKKFKELLPLLTSKSISLRNRGKVFVTYVRSALLHVSECWALKKEELLRLQRNERAMLRWILNFHITDRISSVELYRKLKIPTLDSALRKN